MSGAVAERPQRLSQVEQRLTRQVDLHRVMWLLTVVSFLIAWNRGLALLYGLFSLLLATLLISYILPGRQLRGVEVERRVLDEAFAGQSCRIEYRLTAPGNRYHLQVSKRLPFAELSDGILSQFLDRAEGECSWSVEVCCARRGRYELTDIDIGSAYPFGIFARRRRITTASTDVLVLPRLSNTGLPPLISARQSSGDGDCIASRRGVQDEFATVRDYRHGDGLKHIHWPASAKLQQLVVKEYDSFDKPNIAIVLDCNRAANVGEAAEATFEYAIRVAASVLQCAVRAGYNVRILAVADDLLEIAMPAYAKDLLPALEQLAVLQALCEDDYLELVEYTQCHYPQTNMFVTFRNRSTGLNPEINTGATHVDIEFVDGSFSYPNGIYDSERGLRRGNRLTYGITRGAKFERLFS